MDAASDPDIESVILRKASQVGWTEILNNVIGFHIHHDPAPMLMIQPTLDIAEAHSKDRLAPMLRDTPALSGKVKDPRSRDSGNTLLHKSFPGGHISIGGANSPAGLAARPIRVVICDEVDRYPRSAGTEGDPLSLARKRSITFWNRKFLAGSSPTIKGACRIDTLYEASDQRLYYVPCPDCGHEQPLVWANVKWPDGEPGRAEYMCADCGTLWDDATRWRAVAAGDWRATKPFDGTAGFHLNEIYSPFVTLADMAANFLEAKKLPETLQTFVNTSLAESWEMIGDKLEPAPLMDRRESYGIDPVPAGVMLITAGVDVQDDRIEMEIVGWGRDHESWSLDYHVLRGDPDIAAFWLDVDDLLRERYETSDGRWLRIEAAGVDSGAHTDAVYKYCGRRKARRVWAIKGMFGPGRPIWPRFASKTRKSQTPLYIVGVDTAKARIYPHLRIAEQGPGYCHFPLERDEEYFDQLTSEVAVPKHRFGHPYVEWRLKVAGRRNEALDCRVYALAAMLGRLDSRTERLNRRADRAARRQADVETDELEPVEIAATGDEKNESASKRAQPAKKPKRPRGSGFVKTRRRGGFVKGYK